MRPTHADGMANSVGPDQFDRGPDCFLRRFSPKIQDLNCKLSLSTTTFPACLTVSMPLADSVDVCKGIFDTKIKKKKITLSNINLLGEGVYKL